MGDARDAPPFGIAHGRRGRHAGAFDALLLALITYYMLSRSGDAGDCSMAGRQLCDMRRRAKCE